MKFFNLISPDKLSLIDTTTEISIEDKKLLMVPWLADFNGFAENSVDIMLGHLNIDTNSIKQFYSKLLRAPVAELSNEFISSYLSEHEMSFYSDVINKEPVINNDTSIRNNSSFKPKDAFKFLKENGKIYSGHFHNRDSFRRYDKTFTYVGSPLELTWGECHNSHGFYILDLDTLEDEFVENIEAPRHLVIDFSDINTKSDTELKKYFISNFQNYIQINFNTAESFQNKAKFLSLLNEFANVNRIKTNSTIIDSLKPEDDFTSKYKITTQFDLITRYLNSIPEQEFTYRKIEKDKMLNLLNKYYLKVLEND